jgi:DNA-binding GntR family transcriptional regulator
LPRPKKVTAEASAPVAQLLIPASLVVKMAPSLPKTAQVYEVIRRAIVTLALPPGSVVNEKAICEQLGISRTPLREAMLQLSAENLISVIPHMGTYVSRIDLQNVFDGQLVRDALEMKVVRLAAVKMTPQFSRKLDFNMHQQARLAAERDYDEFYELDEAFHSMICEFGASQRIWRIVNGAKAQLDRVRRLAFPAPTHLDIVLREHTAIVEGLKARDPNAAAAAMKVHLDRVFDTIRRLIVEQSDYFSPWSPEELDSYEAAMRDTGRRRRRTT